MVDNYGTAHIRLPIVKNNEIVPSPVGGMTLVYDIVLNGTLENSYLVLSPAFCSKEDRYVRRYGRKIAVGRLWGFYSKVKGINNGMVNGANLCTIASNLENKPIILPLSFAIEVSKATNFEYDSISSYYVGSSKFGYIKQSVFPFHELMVHSFSCFIYASKLKYSQEESFVSRLGNVNLIFPNE